MEIFFLDMFGVIVERCFSFFIQLSIDLFFDGFSVVEDMLESQIEDGRSFGFVGLVVFCCVCLEVERLRGCFNFEKICIVFILVCFVSFCFCIVGFKWVFVDKIFEYDFFIYFDFGGLGQDFIIFLDLIVVLDGWVFFEVYILFVFRA